MTHEKLFFSFDPALKPAARIRQGEQGVLETHDCFVGQLKFCQVVDPLKTVRFEFPKWVLAEYGCKFRPTVTA